MAEGCQFSFLADLQFTQTVTLTHDEEPSQVLRKRLALRHHKVDKDSLQAVISLGPLLLVVQVLQKIDLVHTMEPPTQPYPAVWISF